MCVSSSRFCRKCVFQRRWVRFDGESLAYFNNDKVNARKTQIPMNPMNRPHLRLQFLLLSQVPGTFLCLAPSHFIVIIIIVGLGGCNKKAGAGTEWHTWQASIHPAVQWSMLMLAPEQFLLLVPLVILPLSAPPLSFWLALPSLLSERRGEAGMRAHF